MEPTQVKYICMKIAASFTIPAYFRKKKKSNIKTYLWIQARGKKPNFLPQLSLVHCPSESWTDYGSSPPIALFWPHSLEEKEYPPASGNKNMGSPWVWKPKFAEMLSTFPLYPGSSLGNWPVPLRLCAHCAAVNTERGSMGHQSPILDYPEQPSLICYPSLGGFCQYNPAVGEK